MNNRYEYIINLSHDFITLIDRDYRYELVNDSYCRNIGRDRESILGTSVCDVWGPDRFESAIKPKLDRCFSGEEIHYIDTFAFGSMRRHMHVSFYPYSENDGKITHVLVFSHDITRLTDIESRLADYEYRDPLTGLFNRRSLEMLLRKEISQAQRSSDDDLRAVLFISLKNFKRVNQTHGHNVGDLLLESTVERIRESIRVSDHLCRFEGVNLVVVLTKISYVTDAGVVAQKLHDSITVPYRFRFTDVTIGCAIGVSVFPGDNDDPDRLVQYANSASVEADALNEPFLYYDRNLHQRSLTRMQLHTELLRSFEDRQLELYYQPIIEQRDNDSVVVGAEALIRWHHPERGLLEPPEFITLAEETGVVKALDKWALYEVTRLLAHWPNVFITVNVSAAQFANHDLVEVIEAALSHSGSFNLRRLKLEITERDCMQDLAAAVLTIERLQQLGVEVWIDDFGIGNSSLAYLKQLPVQTLKIDRAFAEGIAASEEDSRFLAGIIAGIHARGKSVVVEGVVDPRQVGILTQMGCRLMQGFYFGRPMPANDFRKLLHSAL